MDALNEVSKWYALVHLAESVFVVSFLPFLS